MKVLNAIACMLMASLIPAGSASAATLVGHWTLNEAGGNQAIDSVSGNTGVWQNGIDTNLTRLGGIIGGSADLDDSSGNSYFQISSINQLNGADGVTLSAWVDPDAQTVGDGYNGIFMTRNFNNKSNNSWGIAIENSGGEHLDSRVDGPGIDSPPGSLSPNNGWHHVVLTYDAGTKTHTQYINGEQTNTTSVAGDGDLGPTIAGTSNGPWFIGFDNCCNNRDFNGRIDDVSAWTGALTADEVKKLYTSGLQKADASQALGFTATAAGSIQNGLVGHWAMDQVAGTQHAGEAISGNIAALNGANPNTAWVAGQLGNALKLDGGNDQAIVGGAEATNLNLTVDGTTELTMSIWVRSDGANNNNEGIFQIRGPGNSNLTGFNTPSAGNADNFDFRIMGQALRSPGGELLTGEWVHLAGVWESGNRHEMYINGELVALDLTPFVGSMVADGVWRFGEDQCCGNRFFNGALDDAGLWTRGLSEEEIKTLYQAGLRGINLAQASVPEPTTLLALSLGGLALVRRRRSAA